MTFLRKYKTAVTGKCSLFSLYKDNFACALYFMQFIFFIKSLYSTLNFLSLNTRSNTSFSVQYR